MFSDPYRRMYREMAFASGDEGVEHQARKDALRILADAADRCAEQDMQTDEVKAALDYLQLRVVRKAPFRLF